VTVRITSHRDGARALLVLLVSVLPALASPALAQNPHGVPPGLAKKQKGGSGSNHSGDLSDGRIVTGGPEVRSFGVWLDDATTLERGEAWLTVSMQRWASPASSGLDMPVSEVSVGLTSRVQAFATVPFSRYALPGTPRAGRLGDLYFGAKYKWRDADQTGPGIAFSPAVEVLSSAATVDTGLSRTNVVLPVSAEWRAGDAVRFYGSTGYFTRGSWFGGGAVERTIDEHCLVTAALTYARSTKPVESSTAWGLSPQRFDVSGTASWIVSPRLAVFAGVARTLTRLDPDSTRYAVSAGASFDLRTNGISRPPVR
jgi:hypothetical protein